MLCSLIVSDCKAHKSCSEKSSPRRKKEVRLDEHFLVIEDEFRPDLAKKLLGYA